MGVIKMQLKMKSKLLSIESHNWPEAVDELKQRYCIKKIEKIRRKFLKYEGHAFVYIYTVKLIIRSAMPRCQFCGDEIKDTKVALVNGKDACQYCYTQETKGYFK